jgi:hypothetical protein
MSTMARPRKGNKSTIYRTNGSSALGFEAILWPAADKLRNNAFDEKRLRLVARLEEQLAESARLEEAIRANLKGMGYG